MPLIEGATGATESFDAWVADLVEGATGATESFDAWVADLVEGATGQTESFDLWDFVGGSPPGGTQRALRQPGYPECQVEIGGTCEAPRQMGL